MRPAGAGSVLTEKCVGWIKIVWLKVKTMLGQKVPAMNALHGSGGGASSHFAATDFIADAAVSDGKAAQRLGVSGLGRFLIRWPLSH